MTQRQCVLAAYGGVCAWCGATDKLEIDHVQGGGNQHRKRIGVKLYVWLWRQQQITGKWPNGYQILCATCHHKKSGTTPMLTSHEKRFPTREGAQLNVRLPSELVAHVKARGESYEGGQQRLVEQALRTMLEGEISQHVTERFHEHLARVDVEIKSAVEILTTHIARLETLVHELNGRLHALETLDTHRYDTLVKAFDRLKSADQGEKRAGWFRG